MTKPAKLEGAENIMTDVSPEGILTIQINLKKKGHPSKSGKTQSIASTLGNKTIIAGKKKFMLGCNVYTSRT